MKKILALALFTLIGAADARIPLLDKVPGIGKVPVLGKMVVEKQAPVIDAFDTARYNQKSKFGKTVHVLTSKKARIALALALTAATVAGYRYGNAAWNDPISALKQGTSMAADYVTSESAKKAAFGKEWDNTGTCLDITYNNWMPTIRLPFTSATLGGISRADYIARKMAQLAIAK